MTPYLQRNGITIYNANCADVLPSLGRFDLALTDPPYGIGETSDKQASRGKLANVRDYGTHDWDLRPPSPVLIRSIIDAAKHTILWGGNYFDVPPSSCWLVWDKDNSGSDFADCELAWTSLSRAVRKFRWRWNGMLQERRGRHHEARVHPTQKPLALMRWCLGLCPAAQTVLDPFMGSGTTLVAAQLEGRSAVGIDMCEQYCEAAAKRLEQQVLF